MDEIRQWWSQALDELAVLDLRVGLELDEARHELAELARSCWGVIERELRR